MKKSYVIGGAVVAAVVLIGLWVASVQNHLVRLNEGYEKTIGELQNQMQRQADLIPNLVESTKGSAAFERGTLTDVTNARSNVSAVAKMDPTKVANDPELQKKLIEAQTQMSQALVKLNATKEAYPDLKANKQFSDLMVELTGSQNRITYARKKTQDAAEAFNVVVKSFPSSLAAGSYSAKPYFQANEAAQAPPSVKF